MDAGHWSLVEPPGAVVVQVGLWPGWDRTERRRLAHLGSGVPVVLRCAGLGARARCHRFARRADLVPQRSYVEFPGFGRSLLRIEDAPVARRWFATNFLATPPGAGRLSPLIDLAVAGTRLIARGPLFGALVPGRTVIAVTSASSSRHRSRRS